MHHPPSRLFVVIVAATVLIGAASADECQGRKWKRDIGEIVCRYDAHTGPDVNYYTCNELADSYFIEVDKFFALNPGLKPDCSNVQPNTTYCVDGYEQPLLALDGKCGPGNKNATCAGTESQCCNSETWMCGNKPEDCRPGTCYEGACHGADEYSINGKCGPKTGYLLCGGKWGDCCNWDGICGTGPDFCSPGKCESGNCTWPSITSIIRAPPG